jgi:hypothetical protein
VPKERRIDVAGELMNCVTGLPPSGTLTVAVLVAMLPVPAVTGRMLMADSTVAPVGSGNSLTVFAPAVVPTDTQWPTWTAIGVAELFKEKLAEPLTCPALQIWIRVPVTVAPAEWAPMVSPPSRATAVTPVRARLRPFLRAAHGRSIVDI